MRKASRSLPGPFQVRVFPVSPYTPLDREPGSGFLPDSRLRQKGGRQKPRAETPAKVFPHPCPAPPPEVTGQGLAAILPGTEDRERPWRRPGSDGKSGTCAAFGKASHGLHLIFAHPVASPIAL